MSGADNTTPGQTGTLAFEFELPHPPQKVWRALTDPALLSEWLLPVTGLDLAPGAAFTLSAPPQPGWDGRVECQFVEIEPQKKLSYTWRVGDMAIDTVVTFTIAPTASGTRLSLTQSGFKPDQKRAFGGARYGWNLMGGKLVDLLGRLT